MDVQANIELISNLLIIFIYFIFFIRYMFSLVIPDVAALWHRCVRMRHSGGVQLEQGGYLGRMRHRYQLVRRFAYLYWRVAVTI